MEEKNRHWFVSTCLIFMLVANSLMTIFYLFAITQDIQEISKTELFFLIIIGICNVIFLVFLLKWKKWAFWGIAFTSLITFAINISTGETINKSILGLVGVGILFGVLQIGKYGISAWRNLE